MSGKAYQIPRKMFILRNAIASVLLASCAFTSSATDSVVVSVRLLAPSPTVCMGQPTLKLEAVLTNNSGSAFDINVNGIGGVYLQKYKDGKETDSRNGIGDPQFGDYIRVPPHQTVIVPLSWGIGQDEQFGGDMLRTPGEYSIQINYYLNGKKVGTKYNSLGAVLTNKVMFLISDCKDVPLGKTSKTVSPSDLSGVPADTLLHDSGHVIDPPKPQ